MGSYSLHVVMQGFSDFDTKDIRLDVNRVVNLRVSLALAGTKAIAEVSALTATVDGRA